MSSEQVPLDALLSAVGQAPFALADTARRIQGDLLGAWGLNPSECRYRVIASGPFWRLRDYSDSDASSPLLIVAAPIKRPYIWDLAPSVSPIRYCLSQRQHVYLLEWLPASRAAGNHGLKDYAQAISESVARVAADLASPKPILIGHSLGGTLAAICCALVPQAARGLVLLGSPLSFKPGTSPFRDGLASLCPSALAELDPYP